MALTEKQKNDLTFKKEFYNKFSTDEKLINTEEEFLSRNHVAASDIWARSSNIPNMASLQQSGENVKITNLRNGTHLHKYNDNSYDIILKLVDVCFFYIPGTDNVWAAPSTFSPKVENLIPHEYGMGFFPKILAEITEGNFIDLSAFSADWVFDYPSGALRFFNGTALPPGITTATKLYVTCYKYIGPNLDTFSVSAVAGPQGPQGIGSTKGPQGPQGKKGSQGIPGTATSTGASGPQGKQGGLGPNGTQGYQGVPGFATFRGVQGFKGSQGIKGSQGNQGVSGAASATGAKGAQGNLGPTGLPGPQGDPGPQGVTGAKGAQGNVGAGVQGAKGSQGVKGIQGGSGPQGLVGATGYTGPAGPPGPQGRCDCCPEEGTPEWIVLCDNLANADVHSPNHSEYVRCCLESSNMNPPFSIVIGEDEYGVSSGLISNQTLEIVKDTNYEITTFASTNLNIRFNIDTTSDYNEIFVYQKNKSNPPGPVNVTFSVNSNTPWASVLVDNIPTGSATSDLTDIYNFKWNKELQKLVYIEAGDGTGGFGVQGAKGSQGSKGPQGISGSGVQGAKGPQGNLGSSGPQGLKGFQGNLGSGVQGAKGPQGLKGFQGNAGSAGSKGNQGFQGSGGGSVTPGEIELTTTQTYTIDRSNGIHQIITINSGTTRTITLSGTVTSLSPGERIKITFKASANTHNIVIPSDWFTSFSGTIALATTEWCEIELHCLVQATATTYTCHHSGKLT